MTSGAQEAGSALPQAPSLPTRQRKFSFAWLGVLPFFAYVATFLLVPSIWLVVGAFQTDSGAFTTVQVHTLFQQQYLDAYKTSIEISLASALIGGVCGLFVAYSAVKEGAPGWIRPLLTTFSGVAANFAGIPLAFAWVATLGTTGVITAFLANHGIDLYQHGFTLYSFTGLTVVYTYFQMPLMILVISPALDGVRTEWREAATNLGAGQLQFWRYVGIPILWPSLLGAFVLLFGSAFAAYATAAALVGTELNLVPLLIGNVVNGNNTSDPQFGDALALGMIVIIGFTVVLNILLQRRSDRWLR